MDRPVPDAATETSRPEGGVSRRRVLLAGTGTVLAASAVAACGGDGSTARSGGSADSSGQAGAGNGKDKGTGGGEALARVSDVPVGGAVSAKSSGGKPVIVAQPDAGRVVAFSAVCTHQGCTVAPAGKILKCPCHGSTYDVATGKNTGGPAPKPLAKIPVKVEGGKVVET